MKIVIPMAGKSERFFRAGYTVPKPLLPVGGKTMVEQVTQLFEPNQDEYCFIVNQDDERRFRMSAALGRLPVRQHVYVIPANNFGPVFSLLQIADALSLEEEVIVNYGDFLVDWDYPRFLARVRGGAYHGGIASFRGFHPASLGTTYYAYLRVNDQDELLELREKRSFTDNRMAEHASTGTYYFKHWKYLLDFGRRLMAQNLKAGNEFYPSLIFNLMSKDGLKTLMFEVNKFICLGTPEDYEQYVFWSEYFTENRVR